MSREGNILCGMKSYASLYSNQLLQMTEYSKSLVGGKNLEKRR